MAFEKWGACEGWRIPARELALYRTEMAGSAFVLRDDAGVPLGFVTFCRHQRGAWIGNLIVDPDRRGRGFGRRLFRHAVDILAAAGVDSLWLTASAAGRPLYEAFGFHQVGRIERWFLIGGGRGPGTDPGPAGEGDLSALLEADAAAWGESRDTLLARLARGGRIIAAKKTVALLQEGENLRVLGPWLSADLCPRSLRALLGKVIDSFGAGQEIAADLLAGSPAAPLLQAAGFRRTGETVLMVRGETAAVRLDRIVTLASLGSMG